MNEIVSQFDTLSAEVNEVSRCTDSERQLCNELDAVRAEARHHQGRATKLSAQVCAMRDENDRLRAKLVDCDRELTNVVIARNKFAEEAMRLERERIIIGQVTDNGDGTETRILPVRMKCGLVPDGYEVIRAVSRGLTVTPPLLADCGDVLYDELPSCEWKRGEFRLQLKPKANP